LASNTPTSTSSPKTGKGNSRRFPETSDAGGGSPTDPRADGAGGGRALLFACSGGKGMAVTPVVEGAGGGAYDILLYFSLSFKLY